jgi:putative membrane protein (TIGR04086 family)
MKKSIAVFFTFLTMISIIIVSIFVYDKTIASKITIFLSALLSLLLAYITGLTKRRHGMLNGIIIGISIATISLIIHYIFAKDFFDLLYIRSLTVILSGASGGVIGVNKEI